MNAFVTVALVGYMIVIPVAILFRIAKESGLPPRVFARGWRFAGALVVLVFGALLGAEMLLLFLVVTAYLNEFCAWPAVNQAIVEPTLVNLLALLLGARLGCDVIETGERLMKQGVWKASASATTGGSEGVTP